MRTTGYDEIPITSRRQLINSAFIAVFCILLKILKFVVVGRNFFRAKGIKATIKQFFALF